MGQLLDHLQPVVFTLLECGLAEVFEQFVGSNHVDLMSTSIQPISKALLSMQLSLQKVRLGVAAGEVVMKEENARLKDAALRTVDFQKNELEKHGEEIKELQRTIARLSREVDEKDQELKTTSQRALRVEQERKASEKQKQALKAELQASQGRVTSLIEEMKSQAAEIEAKATEWAIQSIYALRPKNPEIDMSDLPEDWRETLISMARLDDEEAVEAARGYDQGEVSKYAPKKPTADQANGDQP
ncbi:dynactin subunit 1-like [Pistacia vera]|uniref:dynactin subunit 1-like n=1 Tax=Pistacia vera TaxID=55513 RepID=UPI001263E31E|nr:dynactin subunit 1-like [Pistacia vera]